MADTHARFRRKKARHVPPTDKDMTKMGWRGFVSRFINVSCCGMSFENDYTGCPQKSGMLKVTLIGLLKNVVISSDETLSSEKNDNKIIEIG